jgi:hypothetical protein
MATPFREPRLLSMLLLLLVTVFSPPTEAQQTKIDPNQINVNLPTMDNVVYIDGVMHATLAAYLVSPSANTTVIVPSNQTISSDTIISVAGLKITCENGAVIVYTSTGRLQMRADRDGIEGCKFSGPGVSVSALQMVVFSSTNQFFRRNYFGGFGTTGSNGEIEVVAGASHFAFSENISYSPNGDWDLYINNCCSSGAVMTDFRVENNDIGEFIAHATSASTQINHIVSAGNHFQNGQASKTEFCEEIGQFGGTSVSDITSSGNTCVPVASGANGGFSFGGPAYNVSETGDVFDANGFTYRISAFECVLVNNSTISGVTANTASTQSGNHDAMTCDRCNTSTFKDNVINGFSTASGASGFHLNVSSTTGPSANNVTISGNTIVFPSGGTGHGIWHQCNATGASCQNNRIIGNHIKSDGTSGSQGIVLENDTGTTANVLIGPNDIIGPATGVTIGPGVRGTIYYLGRNTAATLYSDRGTGTLFRGTMKF